MAIYRAPRPESDYAQIRNDVLRDERLSYRARGLLATILSHTDNWATSAEAMARQGQEGRDAIRTALSELEAAGYLKRERRQDAQGRWSTQAIVYDTPQRTPVQDALLDLVEAPMPENPSSVANAQVTDISAGHTDDWKTDAGKSGANRTPSTKHTVPTERAEPPTGERDLKAEGRQIAQAVYDAAGGMVPFMGVAQIATKALKMPSEPSQETVQQAMLALYAEGRPLTLAVLGQRLNGAKPQTAVSDWSGRTTW